MIAVAEFVIICFLAPMAARVNKIADKLNEMDKKLFTGEELDKAIDLKIYSHMSRCHAHNAHHRLEQKHV